MFGHTEDRDHRERAALLALVEAAGHEGWEWYQVAQAVAEGGSAERLLRDDPTGFEVEDATALRELAQGARSRMEHFSDLIRSEEELGSRCITILDEHYPINLRAIYNAPPFLFVRGRLTRSDDHSIAVVGTRNASPDGIEQATRLSDGLARQGVTVLSGMARGIDTAAHTAALKAGGRTVAVMGTGMHRRYPKENTALADQIEQVGALVSQFWPDAPPARWSFPMRNVVMSGLALGTAVIEASATSGAKMQARLALEHGKLVFLHKSLVLREDWARKYADQRGALVIEDVDEVLDHIGQLSQAETFQQLRLA